MLVSVDWETRIAITNQGYLEEIYIEGPLIREEKKGNIYKGIIEQIQPSINAAFVNIGLEKNTFLALDSVDYSIYPPQSPQKKYSIQDVLTEKQEVIVQVTKDSTSNKGAVVTTFITIPGRYLVLSPSLSISGISKRIIETKEKIRLNKFLDSITKSKIDPNHSVIIRTAAIDITSKVLKEEYQQLKEIWNEILEKNKSYSNPTLLMQEKPFIAKIIRDFYVKDIDEIYVNETNAFQQFQDNLKQYYPQDLNKLQFYSSQNSLFSHFDIEQAIQNLSERKVVLASGAYLVIDQTEALVAIDVNSGSAKTNDNPENSIFQINLEAAQETARQILLRNLSGLIVIDFIDTHSKEQNKKIENTIKYYLKNDKSQHTIYPISKLGLLEISRQKIGKKLSGAGLVNCPSCKGMGKIVSLDAQIYKILRQIKIKAQRGNYLEFTIYLSTRLFQKIEKEKKNLFYDLEKKYNIKINLEQESSFELSDEAELIATIDKNKQPVKEDTKIEEPLPQRKPNTVPNIYLEKFETSEDEKQKIINQFQKGQEKLKPLEKKFSNKYLWKPLDDTIPSQKKRHIIKPTFKGENNYKKDNTGLWGFVKKIFVKPPKKEIKNSRSYSIQNNRYKKGNFFNNEKKEYSSTFTKRKNFSRFDKPNQNFSRFDKPNQNFSRFDKPNQNFSRFDKPNQNFSRFDKPNQNFSRFDKPNQNFSRFDKPNQNFSRPNKTNQNFSRFDKPNQNFSRPNKTNHNFSKNKLNNNIERNKYYNNSLD